MRYARELLSPVMFAMWQPKPVKNDMHGARAADSRSFEGNRSEGMVHMGGDVTVLLDLGLLCLVCCCTHFRGCDGHMESGKVSTQVASQTNNLPFDK